MRARRREERRPARPITAVIPLRSVCGARPRCGIFLHTPDGYGRSELAAMLARTDGGRSARPIGTARNWSTVTRLLALCDT